MSTKTCYEIKKISTFLLNGEEGLKFLQKKINLNLKCLTTKEVDNLFLSHY